MSVTEHKQELNAFTSELTECPIFTYFYKGLSAILMVCFHFLQGAQNSTEMKSKDKTKVTKIQSDSVYQNLNLGQLNEVYGNL